MQDSQGEDADLSPAQVGEMGRPRRVAAISQTQIERVPRLATNTEGTTVRQTPSSYNPLGTVEVALETLRNNGS